MDGTASGEREILYPVHIRAQIQLFHIKKPTNAHIKKTDKCSHVLLTPLN